VNILQPGAGMNVDPTTLDTHSIASLATQQKPASATDFLLQVFPNSAIDAFARNDILQILTFSIFIGVALSHLGERGKPFVTFLDSFAHAMFRIVGIVMRYAPVAAFGAVSFIIGEYGFHTLASLGKLLACMYLTCALFVVIVLGPMLRFTGFSLWKLLNYIKDEIFTLLGTASSESVVPQIMRKMENIGVSRPVVGLMIPSGLTFNPDGQCIYYTMAAIFIAQATNTPLTLTDQVIVLVVLLLTSKGSAGVAGSAFITLAATLTSIGKIPVAGVVLLLGIDMFMAQARSITNTIGNSVATMVVGKWVGALDEARAHEVLNHELTPEELRVLYEN
jgi:aerobic C4-dicarboxylate transport protein